MLSENVTPGEVSFSGWIDQERKVSCFDMLAGADKGLISPLAKLVLKFILGARK